MGSVGYWGNVSDIDFILVIGFEPENYIDNKDFDIYTTERRSKQIIQMVTGLANVIQCREMCRNTHGWYTYEL